MLNKKLITLFIVTICCTVLVEWFVTTDSFSSIKLALYENINLFILFIFAFKILGCVIPPVPGGLFTIAAIPVIGWEKAFLIDLIGQLVGVSISYVLAKNYGRQFVNYIVGKKINFDNYKIKKSNELEAIVLLSLFTGLVMVELSSYVLGVLKVDYKKFLFGNLLSHVIRNIPLYYALEILVVKGDIFLGISTIIILGVCILILNRRYKLYFESEDL